jgi:hypothetical protein
MSKLCRRRDRARTLDHSRVVQYSNFGGQCRDGSKAGVLAAHTARPVILTSLQFAYGGPRGPPVFLNGVDHPQGLSRVQEQAVSNRT